MPVIIDKILRIGEGKIVRQLEAVAAAVNAIEDDFTAMSDDELRASRDPQDEARAENVDELIAVTKEFARNNPDGGLVDFLTEVSLVAAADDLDDDSGTGLRSLSGLGYCACGEPMPLLEEHVSGQHHPRRGARPR